MARILGNYDMEALYQYFIRNFFLLCLTFGVIFMVLRSYRAKKVAILMPILIVSAAVSISIAYAIEQYAVAHPQLVFLATFCFFYGFAVRPLIIYFFLRLTTDKPLVNNIALALVILNAIVYSFSLFRFAPDFAKIVNWYDDSGATLTYTWGPLYFFSYAVVGIMAAYLLFISLYSLKGRRRYDALASLISFAFIVAAVVLVTLNPALVDYSLLNTTIAIACLFYVVHLYQQAANRDGLTNLFDRKTYYADEEKLGDKVLGVIMIDMNSLKRLNDTEGHEAGDLAIVTIAKVIDKCASKRSMYVYRMGGDEFVVLSTSSKPNAIENTVESIRSEMAKTRYSISIGYALRENQDITTRGLIKQAESMMYVQKEAYYREFGGRRRDDFKKALQNQDNQ